VEQHVQDVVPAVDWLPRADEAGGLLQRAYQAAGGAVVCLQLDECAFGSQRSAPELCAALFWQWGRVVLFVCAFYAT
jgi:hypothetical protein